MCIYVIRESIPVLEVSHCMNDDCVGEEQVDEAYVPEVEQHLIHHLLHRCSLRNRHFTPVYTFTVGIHTMLYNECSIT